MIVHLKDQVKDQAENAEKGTDSEIIKSFS
jgi:hypothetical protein